MWSSSIVFLNELVAVNILGIKGFTFFYSNIALRFETEEPSG